VASARLVLRVWEDADAAACSAALAAGLDHLRPWLPWALVEPLSPEARLGRIRAARREHARGRDLALGIFRRTDGTLLGGMGVHRSIGPGGRALSYWLAAGHLGRGYATEAAASVTRVAFDVDRVDRVEIHVDADNVRSAAVPRRLGFSHVAARRQLCDAGVPQLVARPVEVYRLDAGAYAASPAGVVAVEAWDQAGVRLL